MTAENKSKAKQASEARDQLTIVYTELLIIRRHLKQAIAQMLLIEDQGTDIAAANLTLMKEQTERQGGLLRDADTALAMLDEAFIEKAK